MESVLTKQIDNIISKQKQIKNTIAELNKEYIKECEKLKNIENALNVFVMPCKNCHGSGKVAESCGYGGCSTEYYICSKCEGNGYIITEKS